MHGSNIVKVKKFMQRKSANKEGGHHCRHIHARIVSFMIKRTNCRKVFKC